MSVTTWAPVVASPVRLEVGALFGDAARRDDSGLPCLQLLVDGRWGPARGGRLFDIQSPIDGQVMARAQAADTGDVDAAVAAARAARQAFRSMPAAGRLKICQDAAEVVEQELDGFVAAIVSDMGKTPEQATSEVRATVERLRLVREEVRKIFGEYLPGDWIAETAGKSAVVMREPVGTVAAFGPFNYPLFLAASKIIPALAAGNTVVAKAPSDDPVALVLFARAFEEAGLPPGVLNVITGPGGEIGERLAGHVDVSMVSFTGSSSVGRSIAAVAGPKPMHLELGGNAAAIVLADADMELAAEKTVMGAFKNAGQRCDAVSRVLVEADVYDDYLALALKEAAKWRAGDPRTPGVKVGPLIKPAAADAVAALVDDAVAKGAGLLAGGRTDAAYHQPTVLADVPRSADIVWEETFGPVLAVLRVDSLDDALEVANRSRYGLDSSVFTTNLEKAWRAARALECGQVHINDAPAHGVGHFPFGGRKPDSGIGREGLGYSIDECTVLKTVVLPA